MSYIQKQRIITEIVSIKKIVVNETEGYLKIHRIMRKQFQIFIVFVLVLQNITFCLYSEETVGYFHFINPEAKKIRVKFKLINNLIIIPLRINNSDTLNFILDSGVSNTLLTELTGYDSLWLQEAKEVTLHGLGNGEPLKALKSTGNRIDISGLSGENQEICIFMKNVLNLSSRLGMKINGLIGYDLFKDVIAEINYSESIITFHNKKYFIPEKYRKNNFFMPIEMDGSKPYIKLKLVQKGDDTTQVKLFFDSGASHSLWLDQYDNNFIRLPDSLRYTCLGTGLNGKVFGSVGRINKIIFGPYSLSDPIVCYPDSENIKGYRQLGKRHGSIGAEILKRFNIIIDYPHNLLLFKKNKYFRNEFLYNSSGMELVALLPGLPLYIVDAIEPGSAADMCGIKTGDRIVTVDGTDTKELSLSELIKKFETTRECKLKMTVERNGIELKKTMYLRKLI
jgi:hypothetical protein